MILPIGQTILAQAAGPQRMGRVMSVIGVLMLLAPVFGPLLGGAIIGAASWRWIFSSTCRWSWRPWGSAPAAACGGRVSFRGPARRAGAAALPQHRRVPVRHVRGGRARGLRQPADERRGAGWH